MTASDESRDAAIPSWRRPGRDTVSPDKLLRRKRALERPAELEQVLRRLLQLGIKDSDAILACSLSFMEGEVGLTQQLLNRCLAAVGNPDA
jgi:hypothetical protein